MRKLLLVLLLVTLMPMPSNAVNASPNIVLIISDDHGWRDYGFMGHPHLRTPNLDRLAAASLVFPRGYVPTALCSPSLTSIITGRYPHEHLITGNDPPAPLGGKQGNWRNDPGYVAAWEEMRSYIKRQPTLPQLLGPNADNHSVRSKRTPYDAGVRTPIMIRWPGRVKPRRSDQLASSLDLMPTLLKAAGAQSLAGLPGLDLLDDKAVRARRALCGAIFTHDAVDIRNPAANLMTRWTIDGDWKLLLPIAGKINAEQPQTVELYRITADPDERNNLAGKEAKSVAMLKRKLDAWWKPGS